MAVLKETTFFICLKVHGILLAIISWYLSWAFRNSDTPVTSLNHLVDIQRIRKMDILLLPVIRILELEVTGFCESDWVLRNRNYLPASLNFIHLDFNCVTSLHTEFLWLFQSDFKCEAFQPTHSLRHSAYPHQPFIDTVCVLLLRGYRPTLPSSYRG